MESPSGVKPDDDLEITAIGSLYRGPWDKKYWSASRGKDRYPYPIGYLATRNHAGSTYKMEIREGLKGPLFVVTSADGESFNGQTADIAWETFQKKNGSRVKNWNGKRFSSKIDGTELFGFRNPFVQRLLRELVADVSGVAQRSTSSPNFGNEAILVDSEMQSQKTQNLQPYPDLISYLGKDQSTKKRRTKSKGSVKGISKGSRAKRLHSQSVVDPEGNSSGQAGKVYPDTIDSKTVSCLQKYKPSKDNDRFESQEKKNPGQPFLPSELLAMGRVNGSLQARERSPADAQQSDCSFDKHVILHEKSKLIGSENSSLLTCVEHKLHYSDNMLLDRSPNTKVERGVSLIAAVEDNNGGNSAFPMCADACFSSVLDTIKDNSPGFVLESSNKNDLCTGKNELGKGSKVPADCPSDVISKCMLNGLICERQQCNTRCMPPAPEEMLYPVTDTSDDVISKVLIKDSFPDGSSSGSSNASFERLDLDSAGQELAKSMMTFLLPRAVPLLRKTYERRRSRRKNRESKHRPSVSLSMAKHASENVESGHPTDAVSQDNNETRTSIQGLDENMQEKVNAPQSLLENHSLLEVTTICPSAGGFLNDDPVRETEFSKNVKCIIPDSVEDEETFTYHDATRNLPPSAAGNKDPYSVNIRSKVSTICKSDENKEPSSCHARNDSVRLMDLAEKGESLLLDSSLACVTSHKQIPDEKKANTLCLHGNGNILHPEHCVTTDCISDTTLDPTSVMRGMSQCLSSEYLSECNPFERDKCERSGQDPCACSYSIHNVDNGIISSSSDKSLQSSSHHDLTDSAVPLFTDSMNVNANGCMRDATELLALDQKSVLSDKDNPSVVHRPSEAHQEAKRRHSVHYSSASNIPLSESIVCRNVNSNNAAETFYPSIITDMEHGFVASISTGLDLKISNEVQLDEQPQFPMAEGGIPSHYNNLLVAAPLASQNQYIAENVGQEAKPSKLNDALVSSLKKDLTGDLHKLYAPLGSIPQFDDRKGATSCKRKSHSVEAIDSLEAKSLPMEFSFNKNHEYHCHSQLCQGNHVFCPSTETKFSEELRGLMDLLGCYLHPRPVLSILLNSKDDHLKICIICGLSEGTDRNLFMYIVPIQEQGRYCPSFLGYVSLVFPQKGPSNCKISVERSGLQFTPDGQSLVLLNNIKAPHCREQNINCLCSDCVSDCCEGNAIKVVHVEFGYISSLAKLATTQRISSILVCEPNYLVAVEDNGRLHVWIMNFTWSAKLEEFILPSSDHMPSIVEIKGIPKCASLIIGHNGIGGFGLWDISKRVLLAKFYSPGYTVFELLPVGLFSRQNLRSFATSLHTEDCIKEAIQTNSWLPKHAEDIFLSGEDTAVWMLVSAASDLVTEYDIELKGGNASPVSCWRHALLVKDTVIMGSVLDDRATALYASADNGIIGTCDGLVYMWELSTGKYLADLYSFKCGGVSCIEVDAKSGTLAVASNEGQLLVYAQRGGPSHRS